MIIEAEKYNGKCGCGKEHIMTTRKCIIEGGCLSNAMAYIEKAGLTGISAAVYDTNTYKATEGKRPKADYEIVLDAKDLHSNDAGEKLLSESLPEHFDYLIAIGAGTVHDLTRYCAYKNGKQFVSCPTAASVDGFCSSVAVMTWHGYKNTFTAVAPTLVIADLDIISKAPMFLTRSGFGDMIGKYVSLAEWKIANLLTGEYFCKKIYDITMEATAAVKESVSGIKDGNTDAYEKLTYGLLMSGLAMQLLGTSRCASGAEHHISHFIEMQPPKFKATSDALHGEKVGVATLLVSREYHRLKSTQNLIWRDYAKASEQYITDMFGKTLGESITEENKNDCADGITAEIIKNKQCKIFNIIAEIPTDTELLETYKILNVKSSLSDIGISESKKDTLLEYSPLVRNRLTFMRLRRALIKGNTDDIENLL